MRKMQMVREEEKSKMEQQLEEALKNGNGSGSEGVFFQIII